MRKCCLALPFPFALALFLRLGFGIGRTFLVLGYRAELVNLMLVACLSTNSADSLGCVRGGGFPSSAASLGIWRLLRGSLGLGVCCFPLAK